MSTTAVDHAREVCVVVKAGVDDWASAGFPELVEYLIAVRGTEA